MYLYHFGSKTNHTNNCRTGVAPQRLILCRSRTFLELVMSRKQVESRTKHAF